MSAQLYIRIVDENHLDYAVVNAAGDIEQAGAAFHSDQLPNLPRELPTTLLVPGESVLLLTAHLPKTSAAQLRRAVPFALEEQLIDSIDELHFAIGKQNADGNVLVAVVKKTLLQTWLEQCQRWQFEPTVVLPDFLAITAIENCWHVYLDGDRALVRQTAQQGMNVNREQLAELLRLSINAGAADLPATIQIDYDDGNEQFETEVLDQLPVVVNMAAEPEFCMKIFSASNKQVVPINLLQAEFSRTRDSDKKNFWLKTVAILLVAWFALWLIGNITQYFVFKHRLNKAQAQVNALYRQAFPKATDIVDPQLRVQRALQDAQSAAAGGPFLSLLAQVGRQLAQQNHSVTINTINYHDTTITLAVTAPNFQTLSTFVQALQKSGMQVQQQNAQTNAQTVTAQLIIKGGTS